MTPINIKDVLRWYIDLVGELEEKDLLSSLEDPNTISYQSGEAMEYLSYLEESQ